MSKYRPEVRSAPEKTAVPYWTALRRIHRAVAKRRNLIYGTLHDAKGRHCAMGAFWQDNPGEAVDTSLIDEVAAVNDSVPPSATPRERREHVMRWLRWKLPQTTRKVKHG